ncbi:hypothetical protein Acr_09g0005910 [Actinidia rufa]|uniref:CCHC-type domain-containing protein n=1 Tax=Actinidia rufa TaxID=165716 RepID=A0A7J0F624_9ERIC|nr:hypothetical protein Acr_09g0005910 [Actinidia rufa]
MGSTDQSESQALVSEGSRERAEVKEEGHHRGTGKGRWRSQARGRTVRCFYCDQEGHIKRDCPKYKAQDQSSDTAATAVMAVDESEVLLAASDDGKVSKGNKEMLWVKKAGGGYTDWRGMSRQGELLSDMGPMVLERRMDKGSNRCTEVRKASAGVLGGSVMVPGGSGVDVHREAQRKETKSILRSYTAKGAVTPKRVSFALDLISGGVLSSCAHKGGEMEPRQLAKALRCGGAYTSVGKWSSPLMRLGISDAVLQSYGGAGSEVVRKDNLKTSDYPPVGWRGRLLSPAHLNESKPTWMSPSPVAKPKPDWSSYGVSM